MSAAREHRIRAADGWRLSVLDLEPAGPAWGVVVAGHAMMVDRRTLVRADRPCLAAALVDAGLRVLLPDLRGHGASGPRADQGGDWSYDQLVEDTAVYLELARTVAPGLPLATLGHSLFGHTTLAWLAAQSPDRRHLAPSAHVALCCDFWLRSTEDRPLAWPVKAALTRLLAGLVDALGSFPARRLGVGSADEAVSYVRDFRRCSLGDVWAARSGRDFRAGLPAVDVPTLLVVSERDRLAPPRTAVRLWSGLPRLSVWQLGRPPFADLRPSHMGTVTDPHSAPLWRAIATWLQGHLHP